MKASHQGNDEVPSLASSTVPQGLDQSIDGGFPLISVVIPAFNGGATVGGAISSALSQTYPNVEVIVVNDGSTDDTLRIANGYADRIRVIDRQHSGASSTRNAGAAAARGEFIAFLDCDDFITPTYLENSLATWRRAGGGRRIVASNAFFLSDDGFSLFRVVLSMKPPARDAQRLAILQGNFVPNYVLFPAAIFRSLGGFDEALEVVEDWDLWIRAIYADVEVVIQLKPQALYRWRAGSLSSNLDRMLEGEDVMLRRVLERDDLSETERTYLLRRLTEGSPRGMRIRADAALLSGEYAKARQFYRRAAGLDPRNVKLQVRAFTMFIPLVSRFWQGRLRASSRPL